MAKTAMSLAKILEDAFDKQTAVDVIFNFHYKEVNFIFYQDIINLRLKFRKLVLIN